MLDYKMPTRKYGQCCRDEDNVLDEWIYMRINRIRNEFIRKKVGVVPIVEKMVESCLAFGECGEDL